jgi:hypothetical protein
VNSALHIEAEPKPFTLKELIRSVLDFANSGQPANIPGARVLELPVDGRRQRFYVAVPELHAELRQDLASILRNDLSGPRIARLIEQASEVQTELRFERERGELRERIVYKSLDPADTIALALLRLRVSEHEKVLRDIAQCQLASCGKFFFKSEQVNDPSDAGRRRYKFCEPLHMRQAQRGGAERTARWRERKAAAAATKHK